MLAKVGPMDSTGGDLAHAAGQVDGNIEKRSIHDVSPTGTSMEKNIVGEKDIQPPRSFDTSSEDSAVVEKLDSKIVKVRDAPDGDEAFAHLPDHEKAIVKRQLEIPPVKVTFVTLYRYATRNDLLILFISALCAIIGGAVMPLMTVCV